MTNTKLLGGFRPGIAMAAVAAFALPMAALGAPSTFETDQMNAGTVYAPSAPVFATLTNKATGVAAGQTVLEEVTATGYGPDVHIKIDEDGSVQVSYHGGGTLTDPQILDDATALAQFLKEMNPDGAIALPDISNAKAMTDQDGAYPDWKAIANLTADPQTSNGFVTLRVSTAKTTATPSGGAADQVYTISFANGIIEAPGGQQFTMDTILSVLGNDEMINAPAWTLAARDVGETPLTQTGLVMASVSGQQVLGEGGQRFLIE